MTIVIYLYPGSSDSFAVPAVDCALALSGCDVMVFSGAEFKGCVNINSTEANECAAKKYPKAWDGHVTRLRSGQGLDPKRACSIARHCCLAAYQDMVPSWPTLNFDWDMLCTTSIIDLEHTLPQKPLVLTSGCFMVRKPSVLDAWVDWLGRQEIVENDMNAWHDFAKQEMPNDYEETGSTSLPYIDRNMHVHTDVWEHDPDRKEYGLYAKRLIWQDGKPFFIRKSTGELHPARIMHCFGTYLHEMPALRAKLVGPELISWRKE